MIEKAKASFRQLVNRVLHPHLAVQTDEIERRVASMLAVPSPDLVLLDFNHRLHELRSIELRRLDLDGGVLLSAGCAGAWYFDWVNENVASIGRHIGVELYEPEPRGLGDSVEWIAESASDMPSVASNSVDAVFSGQNIEHLDADMIVGFLTESNRVLKEGGRLIVDSPNRYAVEQLGWIHPEHTIEMTADEAITLFRHAGFEPTIVRGLWRCRALNGDGWLPLTVDVTDARELMERAVGRRSVDDDFVWWIECERVGAVDADALRSGVQRLFELHWENRVNRTPISPFEPNDAGEVIAPAGSTGVLYRTHAFPLFQGSYDVRSSEPNLRVKLTELDGIDIAEGVGSVEGTLDRSILGVHVELVADAALEHASPPLRVTVAT